MRVFSVAPIRRRASTPSAPVGHVPHVADGTVRGALLGDGVVVVADAERRRDPSFGAWLYRLRPGEALYSAVVVRFTGRIFAEDAR